VLGKTVLLNILFITAVWYIIETTAWIHSKFCTPVKTTKYALWLLQKHCKQIQDGGRPPSWKIEKSWYLSNHL